MVQHIAEGFTAGLVAWLGQETKLRAKVAEAGEVLSAGTVYFAPDNKHLVTSMGRVRLDDGPRVRGFKPSATVLFSAVARDYGAAGVGVVLTGMGDDGVLGLKLMKDRGGQVLAQDEGSSVVWGMPRAAIEANATHAVLPLRQFAPTLRRLSTITRASGRKPRLLLVDDSETILMLERALLKNDFELFLARNGQEAVASSRTLELDAVLMDYSMPVMDGETALRQMRTHAATASLPVVIITGETDPVVRRRCTEAGGLTVVSKPFDERALRAAIALALRTA